MKKGSHVIALNFGLEVNLAQKVTILHVLRSFVNNISSFSNQILIFFLECLPRKLTNILVKKESYVIALNFDLEANLAQKVIILHVLRSFVNNISSLSN